jgi:glycosyltransferase involved in cell wall biosynthesis
MAQVMDRNLIGGRAIPIDVIPNFRDTRTTEPPDEGMLAALPAEPFALFVGAFRRVKGLEVLFAAYERLPDPPPLVLIGTRALDTPSFPDGVTVLENATYDTVMAAWQRALFGVFPSTVPEGLGNVVHEAMSAGRAVIGTTPGGHADMIVDGETGFLVPAGDVDRLSAAIGRLVSDSVLRGRMEAAARMRARAYTPDVIMPRMEALYGLALRAGGRRRRP